MAKILANGINIHYQQRGSGPDVVLIHGISSSLAMWYNGILPALTPEFRVTAYDMRGHGLTDITPNGYSSFDASSDLIALLDALGLEKVVVVGHSFGGAIATHAALRFPERIAGVVMMDTGLACLRYLRMISDWAGWETRPKDMIETGFTVEQFLDLDSKQDATAIIRRGLTVPRRAGFKKGQTGHSSRSMRLLEETKMGYEFRDVAGMTEEKLKEVATPVLAMYGETSPYKKIADHLAGLLQNCCEEVLPGAGHFYAVHQPARVTEKIVPFLKDPMGFVTQAKVNPDQGKASDLATSTAETLGQSPNDSTSTV